MAAGARGARPAEREREGNMSKSVSLSEASALLDGALTGPARKSGAKKKKAKRKTTRKAAGRPAKRKTTKRKTTKRATTRRPAKRKTTKRKTTKRATTRRPAKRKTTKRKTPAKRRTKRARPVNASEREMLGLKSHPFDAEDEKFLGDFMGFKKKHGRRPSIEEMNRYHGSGSFLEKPKKRTNWAKIKPSDWPKYQASGG